MVMAESLRKIMNIVVSFHMVYWMEKVNIKILNFNIPMKEVGLIMWNMGKEFKKPNLQDIKDLGVWIEKMEKGL